MMKKSTTGASSSLPSSLQLQEDSIFRSFGAPIKHLPLETCSYVFSFLDTITCIRNKAVCKDWYMHTSDHCGYLQFQEKIILSRSSQEVEISVKAQETVDIINQQTGINKNSELGTNVNTTRNGGYSRCQLKRTRGHLPNPNVLNGESKWLKFHSSSDTTSSAKIDTLVGDQRRRMQMVHQTSCSSSQITVVAIRFVSEQQIRERFQTSYVTCLDLESIRISYPALSSSSNTIASSMSTRTVATKSHQLKKSIQVLDLSSLRYLMKLSVRGCSNLHILRLPPYLEGLDASACSSLKEINFPSEMFTRETSTGCNDGKQHNPCFVVNGVAPSFRLKALNLNGCRSLVNVQFFDETIKSVTELDMTSVSSISSTLIANVLKHSENLRSVSLRYVATDNMIRSLAVSKSARQCLHLVDISFSNVTDKSIEALVNNSFQLARCNLRGNKYISGECYNQVPIYLSRRNRGFLQGEEVFTVMANNNDDKDRKRRKGDNIFFFVND